MLTRMATAGLTYGEALQEAMEKGYAEADPTLDINGMDAAHKAIIIASLAYGSWLPCDAMHVEGIESVDLIDMQFAEKLGHTIKLLSVIKAHDDGAIEDDESEEESDPHAPKRQKTMPPAAVMLASCGV